MSETNYFLRVPKEIEIVNLGSSHGMAGIKYPKEINGYNLALNSQTMYYDLKILQKYKNNIKKDGIVIIPISIFSFYGLEDIDNNKYYNFLNYKDIENGKKNIDFLYKNFYIFYNGRILPGTIKFVIKSLINKKFDYQYYELKEKKWEEKDLINEAIETGKKHLAIKEVNISFVKEILDFCDNNNLKSVLVTTPQSYLYNNIIGEKNYQERIYDIIALLQKEKDFIYLDYSHDKRFEREMELFYDDDHLNKKGANLFTKILLDDINKKLTK